MLIVSPGNSVLLEAPPFVASITVPAEAIGTLPLTAVAFYEESNPAFAQIIEMNVAIAATLTSIETTNGDIVLQRPGSKRQLTAMGTFSDGVRRDITQAALGTQYVVSNLNPSAPTVLASAGGLITAINPGIATVAIRNGNVITSITATVGEPACGDEVLDPGEECDDGNVTSGDGCSSTCFIDNFPPDCSSASASPAFLLASSNLFSPIEIEGVSDPDGDSVTVTATQILQDEPVSNLWCPGGTCADATLEPLTVRAERDTWSPVNPQPDGRVYHITFQATDERGATCTGVATVCVQRRHNVVSCGDGGPLYDSLTPTP
jgi:cysteine-rich repeat protein